MWYIIGLLVVGLITGIYSGLLGLGGGLIIIPCLLYIFKKNIYIATATSLAVIIPTAIVGSFKHYGTGDLDVKAFIFLSVGSVVGAYLGASLAPQIPQVVLKRILGVVILLIGLQMTIF